MINMDGDLKDIPINAAMVLRGPPGKAFNDFRDRAAYVHVTGHMPTHLRRYWTRRLVEIIFDAPPGTALHRAGAPLGIVQLVAKRLDLDGHPMVMKVREKLQEGYRISLEAAVHTRRPFGRIYMARSGGGEGGEICVQIDGSILDHWR